MKNSSESILIFTNDALQASTSGEAKRGGSSVSYKMAEVTINNLQDNMRQFLNGIDNIISSAPKEIGGLTLDEIEIHANIDGKGNIGISGIIGAELAIQGGIKFVLRKKP
jgi:hypothetical protein